MRRWQMSLLVWFFVGIELLARAEEGPVPRAEGQTPSANEAKKSGALLSEEILKIRDPFRMPVFEATKALSKSDLEKYSVESFKLIGVLTGPERVRAMLLAPDGKTYFVAEKMKIGLRGGVVKKITTEYIKIREKIVNVVGQEENIDTEIRLPADTKPAALSSKDPLSNDVR